MRWIRAAIRRVAIRMLTAVGVDARSASDVVSDLVPQKVRLALALGTSIIAPVAEVAFIMALYALVEPAQQEALRRTIAGSSFAPVLSLASLHVLLAVAAGLLLVLTVVSKYLFGYAHAQFLLGAFITQARRIMQGYLHAVPMRAAAMDSSRIASLTLTDSFQYGRVVFSLLDALSNGIAAICFVVAALVASPGMVLVAGVVAVLTLLITAGGYKKQKEVGAQAVEANAQLLGGVWEILNGYRIVKVEGAEDRLLRRLASDLESKQTWRLAKARNELYIKLGTEATLYLALLAIVGLAVGVLRVEASLVLVFLVLMGRLQKYLGLLQQSWIQLQHALPSMTAMSNVIAACAEDATAPVPPDLAGEQPAQLDVVFDRVSFGYVPGRPIVEDLTMRVPPGERVLIQGPSGQGKSTVLFLACGLLDPSSGRVLLNGQPLTSEVFFHLRPSLAYIAPNTYLFRGSIRANLCLGSDYTTDAIMESIRRARLQTLVDRMPEGIDSDIGDNGSKLSLGERQRLMLARMFLKRPRLILLDEATANLDLDNERAILTDLFTNMPPETTVIMVTHRAPLGVAFTQTYVM